MAVRCVSVSLDLMGKAKVGEIVPINNNHLFHSTKIFCICLPKKQRVFSIVLLIFNY